MKVVPLIPAFMGVLGAVMSSRLWKQPLNSQLVTAQAQLLVIDFNFCRSRETVLRDYRFVFEAAFVCLQRLCAGCSQICSPDNIMQLFQPLLIFRLAVLAAGVPFGFTSSASSVQQLVRQTEPQHDYVWRKKEAVCALRSCCLTKWQRWQDKHAFRLQ